MEIRLKKLSIKKFKGVRNFILDLDGKSAAVFGRNATGKTTVCDAWNYLFCDCDSSGRGFFPALELNEKGNEIENQDADIEAILNIDGVQKTYRKVYRQKWTKVRGKAHKEFSGHTTTYYIDDIRVKKKDFTDDTAQLFDCQLFKSLSDIRYFALKAKPDYRRQMLVDLAGNINDSDIVENDSDFDPVKHLIIKNGAETAKVALKSQRQEINRQLDDLPKLIAEHKSQLKEFTFTEDEISCDIAATQTEIDTLRGQLLDLDHGFDASRLRSEKLDLQNEIRKIDAEIQDEKTAILNQHKLACRKADDTRFRLIDKIKELGFERKLLSDKLDDLEKAKQNLVEKWRAAQGEKHADTCAMCGQKIPPEKITDLQRNKAEKIKQLDTLGRDLTAQIKQTNDDIKTVSDEINRLEKEKGEIITPPPPADELTELEKKGAARKDLHLMQLTALESSISDINQDKAPEKEKIKEIMQTALLRKKELNHKYLDLQSNRDKTARINELTSELKNAAIEYEAIEHKLDLVERFCREKATLLEESVSSYFKITRWQLFEIQINGGLKDICEASYNGVKFSAALNTGAQINIGLDIIKTLSSRLNKKLPVFIDNCECLTDWIVEPKDFQIIRFNATPDTPQLDVMVT